VRSDIPAGTAGRSGGGGGSGSGAGGDGCGGAGVGEGNEVEKDEPVLVIELKGERREEGTDIRVHAALPETFDKFGQRLFALFFFESQCLDLKGATPLVPFCPLYERKFLLLCCALDQRGGGGGGAGAGSKRNLCASGVGKQVETLKRSKGDVHKRSKGEVQAGAAATKANGPAMAWLANLDLDLDGLGSGSQAQPCRCFITAE
jgi:hypothetical protein